MEVLFGQIRQRGGSNNNPNVVQFKTAMKQILLKNAIKCKNNGNCNTFDDDAICSIFDFKWNTKRAEFTDEVENSDGYDMDISDRLQQLNNLNPYLQNAKENILYYILGYVVRKVIRTLDFQTCKDSLLKKNTDHIYNSFSHSKFFNLKNNGGLISGSLSSFKIIMEVEKMLLILTNNLKSLNISKLDEKIIHYCNNKFSLDQTIFKELDCTNISILERPHKMIIISLLTKKYLSVRLKSLGKTTSLLQLVNVKN